MSKPRTTRVVAGVYEINGTADRDGKPYRAERSGSVWLVTNSRGGRVSLHATLADAVGSVEHIDHRSFTDGMGR